MWGWGATHQWEKQLPYPNSNEWAQTLSLEYVCIKEIGWVHPLMPLGYFSSFSCLFVGLPVPLKDKDRGSESLIIVSFPRMESHYHLVHIFITIRWVIHSHYRQRVLDQENHSLEKQSSQLQGPVTANISFLSHAIPEQSDALPTRAASFSYPHVYM